MSIITTPHLQRLWSDAQDHPEWATTRLWKYVFHHLVFSDEKWVVSSQQPPTHKPGDPRRLDIVVESWDSSATTTEALRTLLFVVATPASASPSEIEQVEYQAFTAACAHIVETKIESVWAMTCVGSAARLWLVAKAGIYLIPFVAPGESLTDRGGYLEITTHGQDVINALEYIKEHPVPPKELLGKRPLPRPEHARLPPSWHDSEVAEIDQILLHAGA
ncbi:hypothetical protein SPI_03790 [Niveomyces insectorum RCEF 264]|uniref:Uncharacterized protein n=1 Tax=Niveomyces insectorum RCEF 264 TaxID=1081102 RepID=A0A167WCZ0_9HYPO|nr:hypothetical protein SPI_03790 [Niveomyces insectorum RCEF 264]